MEEKSISGFTLYVRVEIDNTIKLPTLTPTLRLSTVKLKKPVISFSSVGKTMFSWNYILPVKNKNQYLK
jgi:hypothetical protein